MRAAFILAGGFLLQTFHWIIYVFGGLLVITGVRLLRQKDGDVHPERNFVVRMAARILPVSREQRDGRFVVREGSRRLVTPLFLTLVTVEASDLMFAVDSIPAVFAITRDPFIVFTSNIFAILGLRALYFLLASGLSRIRYLNVGLAGVLVFVGVEMLLSGVVAIPVTLSLAVVAITLAASVAASFLFAGSTRAAPTAPVGPAGVTAVDADLR
jgi:tellurite resistance protein TerC